MAVKRADRAGDSGAEERFAQLFCEAFGEEKGQFVYLQHALRITLSTLKNTEIPHFFKC